MRTDPEVRAALLPQLRAERPEALLVQEWGIESWPTREMLIVDVATVGPDLVEAWEIKSAADSFARLPKQVPLYSALFDRCTLVTSRSHMASAARMLCGPLDWWGLTLAEGGRLEVAREAEPNPGPYSVAGLLWSSELQEMARHLGAYHAALDARRALHKIHYPRDRPPRAPDRTHLVEVLAGLDAVPALVREALRARAGWRSPDGTHAKRDARRRDRQKRAEEERNHEAFVAKWNALGEGPTRGPAAMGGGEPPQAAGTEDPK